MVEIADLQPDDIARLAPKATSVAADPASGGLVPKGQAAPDAQVAQTTRPERAARGATDPDAPEPTWGEVGKSALKNIGPSTGQLFGDIGHAIVNPKETGKGLLELGKGAVSKVEGALGKEQDPTQKAHDEEVLNHLFDHYGQTYGSVKGFKEALSKDPASVAFDLSTVATGGAGALARGVGEASLAGKALRGVSKAASYANPVDNAVRIASMPVRAAANVARGATAALSGMPVSLQKAATAAYRSGDAAKIAEYARFARGQGDATDILETARAGTAELAKKASDEYAASKAGMAALKTTPRFNAVDDAIAQARADLSIGTAGGAYASAFTEKKAILDRIVKLVADHKADASAHTFIDFDKMKRAIYDIGKSAGQTGGDSPATMVSRAYKDSIKEVAPGYSELMDNWRAHIDDMNQLRGDIGTGRNANATASLAKMLRAAKTPHGDALLKKLTDTEAGKHLPYQLAGAAAHPWFRHGTIGAWEGMVGAGLSVPHILANPIAGPLHVAGAALTTMPRVVGATNALAGRGARAMDIATSPAALASTNAASQATVPTADNTYDRLLQAESGNQQFDKSGATITSPKGAVGAAQVMDSTGPEAAKLAGVPWDANRLRTDAAYNKKLGKAYYDKMRKDFGDTTAALAAYNAGPGAVRRAMEKAKATGQNYLTLLPRETQDYVRKIMGTPAAASGGRVQRASGGRAGIDPVAEAKALCALAERSKRDHGEHTKPLLDAHDDTITNALAIASKTI